MTDDDGATDSVTKQVVITGPPAPFALDEFDRTVTGGWGSADSAEPGSRSGSATNFTVNNGAGDHPDGFGREPVRASRCRRVLQRHRHAGAGRTGQDAHRRRHLPSSSSRGSSARTDYYVDTKFLANGTVNVTLAERRRHGHGSCRPRSVTGLTFSPGDQLNIRVQAVGTSGTTLRAKVWKVGTHRARPTGPHRSPTPPPRSRPRAASASGTYLTAARPTLRWWPRSPTCGRARRSSTQQTVRQPIST